MSTDATFDASTTVPAAPDGTEPAHHEPPPPSALDELAAQIEERERALDRSIVVEVPGLTGVRLRCSTVVPYAEYRRWQLASLPVRQRKSRRPTPLAMSQLTLACMVLVNTCEALEHKVGDRWEPMRGRDGHPMTLESDELLARYNIIDAHEFVAKLFGRDADVINAGSQVMIASGWLEDDDDEDPMG